MYKWTQKLNLSKLVQKDAVLYYVKLIFILYD